MFKLCSGFGQYHSANHKTNPKPYLVVADEQIISMAKNPPSVDKSTAQWIIPSTLLSREATAQRDKGEYPAVWCDFDNHTELESIKQVLTALECFYLVYSSRSSKPDYQKWRVIIFLATAASSGDWQLISAVVNDKFQTAGIEPDRASERHNQVAYLPNRGDFYQYFIAENLPYLNWQQTLFAEIEAKKAAIRQQQNEIKALQERSRLKAAERMATGKKSPVQAFNEAYDVDNCLLNYGYTKRGNRYLSPNSQSGIAGVSAKDNRWFSSHASDSGIGKQSTGGCSGDAFDLFVYYECNGNYKMALKKAGDMFTTANGLTLNKASQIEFMTQKNHPDVVTPDREPDKDGETQQPPFDDLHKLAGVESFQELIADINLTDAIGVSLEEMRLTPSKTLTINNLLTHIEPTNLRDVCISLGWVDVEDKYPNQTDIAIAIVEVLLATAKQHNWHLIHNAGYFYIYNAAYWVALEDKEVKHFLKNAAMKVGYAQIKSRSFNFVDKLFQQVQQDGFFTERTYRKQSIINLKNGSLVINEDGVNLKAFDYRDFLTHQLDFDYNPAAYNPTFSTYLNQVLPNADTRKTLQQALGYVFTKVIKLEKIIFLFGLGANGKSVIFEVLTGIIGDENISNYSLESLTDNNSYNRAMIKDKIINYGTDIKIAKIDPANLKTLASGEPIEARLPYRDPFMMTDYAKLIFNCNKLDSANIEHTHGFFRRLLIIPFMQTIPDHQQDADLHNKILQDKAGVLNWIIDGAREVIKNRKIFISEECENFKKQFIKESDSVAMFEEQAIREDKNRVRYLETVTNAYLEYKSYCSEAGHKPLGRTNFSKRMEAIGFKKYEKNSATFLEKEYL